MATNIQLQIYKEMALSMHCHKGKGAILPAKPLLLIGLCYAIEAGHVGDNRVSVDELEAQYRLLQGKYGVTTPFNYPTYFLASEPFYHIKWKGEKIVTKAPSAAMLRTNVDYIYLDNALWDVLQDKSALNSFRTSIEDYYLK